MSERPTVGIAPTVSLLIVAALVSAAVRGDCYRKLARLRDRRASPAAIRRGAAEPTIFGEIMRSGARKRRGDSSRQRPGRVKPAFRVRRRGGPRMAK
jgi:hypothetical protein